MLTGFIQADQHDRLPVQPEPRRVQAATADGHAAGERRRGGDRRQLQVPADLADQHRASTASCLWGLVGTGEFIYNRDVNGMAYINANLPAAQSAFTGVDNRPRYTSNRINNVGRATRSSRTSSCMNQSIGRSWTAAASVTKPLSHGFTFKSAYSYGVSKNTVDPGSIASGSWTNNPIIDRPEQPGARLLGELARAPVLHQHVLHHGSTSGSARRRSRRSSTRTPTGTPATSSRATPTATRRRPTT